MQRQKQKQRGKSVNGYFLNLSVIRRLGVSVLLKLLFTGALLSSSVVLVFNYWPDVVNWINRPIAKVEVNAVFDRLDRRQIERQLSPLLVNRFFYIDVLGAEKVLSELPWVSELSVARQWPDTLVVELKERKPVARWSDDALVDVDGEIFRPDELESFSRLPKLLGPAERSREMMKQYLAFSQVTRPLGVVVRELRLSTADSWQLTVDHVDVSLGRDRRMERLQRFIHLYHSRLGDRWQDVRRIDLRYMNGASVAWK